MKFKVDTGGGKQFEITQSVGDLKAGLRQNDLSRISAYRGDKEGIHTGANSPTIGRHNEPFKPFGK